MNAIRPHNVVPFIVALLAVIIGVTCVAYRELRDRLELESNNLCSKQAALVHDDPETALDLLPQLGPDARLILQPLSSDRMVVIAANDITRVPIPYHNGSGFSNAGSEVMTGADVRDYESEHLTPVGVLGIEDNSLLSDMTAVFDTELFRSTDGTVIVDGAHAAQTYRTLAPATRVELLASGSLQHDIDLLTPTISLCGYLLVALGSISAGTIVGMETAQRARTYQLLGWSKMGLVVRDATLALVAILGMNIAVVAFLYTAGVLTVSMHVAELVALAAGEGLIAVAACLAPLARREAR